MIFIKKTSKYAINIFLDKDGAHQLKEYLSSSLEEDLPVFADSIGFDNQHVQSIKISTEGKGEVSQKENRLLLNVEEDDIDYFIFKLDQYLTENEFIPEELFDLSSAKKGVTINFFLTKYTPSALTH